ncbi:MAG: hypothetical protein K1X83_14395 [Oligoflexia bacterium]|nr:hypothetical protein [Oligoflexia bacterium]
MKSFREFVRSAASKPRGIFVLNHCPFMQEALVTTALDFVVIDVEASPFERRELLFALQALKSSELEILVRVKNKTFSDIEQVLDLGVFTLVVPKVNTAAETKDLVNACYFPPLGRRGLNPVRSSRYFEEVGAYVAAHNNDMTLLVQIETKEGLLNVDSIVAQEGVHGVFVGLGDLALALEVPLQIDHQRVTDALVRIKHSCAKHGKLCGSFAPTLQFTHKLEQELGYDFVATGNDILWLKRGLAQLTA